MSAEIVPLKRERRDGDCPECPCVEHYYDPERGWKTRPAWLIGMPAVALMGLQHDVRTPDDLIWLREHVRRLMQAWEARTGRVVDSRYYDKLDE